MYYSKIKAAQNFLDLKYSNLVVCMTYKLILRHIAKKSAKSLDSKNLETCLAVKTLT